MPRCVELTWLHYPIINKITIFNKTLGDSGGGLYVLHTVGGKSKYILSGVTSFGIGCGQVGTAG